MSIHAPQLPVGGSTKLGATKVNNDRVQALEALLNRVQKNAAEPRPARVRAPVGGAGSRAEAAATEAPHAPGGQATQTAAPKPVAAKPGPSAAPTAPTGSVSPPKATGRLIEAGSGPSEDPSQWSLSDLDAQPSPKPPTASAAVAAAAPPVPAARASAPGAPAPRAQLPIGGAVKPAAGAGSGMRGFGTKPVAAVKPGARPAFGFGAKAESPRPPKVEPALSQPPEAAPPAVEASALSAAVLSVAEAEPPRQVPNLAASAIGEEESSEATLAVQQSPQMIEIAKPVEAPVAPEPLNLPPPPPLADDVSADHALADDGLRSALTADQQHDAPPAAPSPDRSFGEPAHAEQTRAPDSAPQPEPVAVFAAPAPETFIPATPAPVVEPAPLASKPAGELPAFSAGSVDEAPSKFLAPAAPPAKRGFGWVLVVALLIVVGTLVFFYLRRQQTSTPALSTPTATAGATTKPALTSAPTSTSVATADASGAAPAASGSAGATSAGSASAANGSDDSPPGDPKALPATKGYIFVETPKADASIFVLTTNIGAANKWLEAACKTQFIRPGKPGPAGPQWVAEGKNIDIPCQGAIKVTIP